MQKTTFLARFARAHLVPFSRITFDASHFTVFLHNLVVCLEFIIGMNGTDIMGPVLLIIQ